MHKERPYQQVAMQVNENVCYAVFFWVSRQKKFQIYYANVSFFRSYNVVLNVFFILVNNYIKKNPQKYQSNPAGKKTCDVFCPGELYL